MTHLEQVDPVISVERSCSLVVFSQSGQVWYLTDEIRLPILLIDSLELQYQPIFVCRVQY